LLATAPASLAVSPGRELRPLGGVEPARAPAAERRDPVARKGSGAPEEPARPSAAGYGRPAARFALPAFAPSAFMAQLLAQAEEVEGAQPRREEGVAAYRRALGDDLLVVGPAGAIGLIL